MKLQLYIFYLIILLLNTGCQKASSQTGLPRTEPTPIKEERNLIATVANSKYGLSLLFYQNSNEKFPFLLDVQMRVDKTKESFDLYSLMLKNQATSDDSANFWSPDEEYLVLPCDGLSVIKSSEILKLFKPKLDLAQFCRNLKNIDFIEILTDKQNPEFRLRFKKWKNNTSFLFGVSRVNFADRTKTNDEFVEFRYDFASKTLYRKTGRNKEENPYKFAGLLGKNKKGLIRPGSMKNEITEPEKAN